MAVTKLQVVCKKSSRAFDFHKLNGHDYNFILRYTVQLLHVGPQLVACYERYATVGACHHIATSKNTRLFGMVD